MEIPQKLQKRMNKAVKELKEIISDIQKDNLLNTQEALNFIDDINMLSVSF